MPGKKGRDKKINTFSMKFKIFNIFFQFAFLSIPYLSLKLLKHSMIKWILKELICRN